MMTDCPERITWGIGYQWRDLWIGVFPSPERYDDASGDYVQRTYICLIPMFPIIREAWRSGV
jgi:hypothetical protein